MEASTGNTDLMLSCNMMLHFFTVFYFLSKTETRGQQNNIFYYLVVSTLCFLLKTHLLKIIKLMHRESSTHAVLYGTRLTGWAQFLQLHTAAAETLLWLKLKSIMPPQLLWSPVCSKKKKAKKMWVTEASQ